MKTPRTRFTVLPFLMAFLAALHVLPATRVVNVHARGLGLEHEQPWLRAVASALSPTTLRWGALAAAALIVAWFPDAMFGMPFMIGALTEGRHAGEFLHGDRADGGSRENITVLSGQNLKAGAVVGRVNKGVGRASTPTVVGTGNGTMSQVFAGPEVQKGNYVVTLITVVAHGGVFSVVNPSGKALPNLTLTAGAGNTTTYRSREINFSITDGSTDFALADAFTIVVDTTAPLVIGTGNGTVSAITLGPDARPGNYRLEITAAITNGGEFKLTDPDGELVEQGFIVAGAGGTFVGANKRQINFTLTEGSTDFAVGDAFNIAVFNELSGGKVVAWDPTAVDGRDDVAGVLFDNVDATAGDLAGVIIVRDAVVIKSSLEWAAAITAAQKESAYQDLAARGVIAR